MTAFAAGDRVAWSHSYATDHAEGSIVRAEVVGAKAPDSVLGTVNDVANEEGTWFGVALDNGETMVLTEDELVKVVDEAPASASTSEAVVA